MTALKVQRVQRVRRVPIPPRTRSKIYLKFEGSNIKYQIDYSICEKILAYFTEANE